MKIIELVKTLGASFEQAALKDFEVRGISANSKKVRQDYIFVAVKGTRTDGRAFIKEAVEHGARAVIVEEANRILPGTPEIPVITVGDARVALGRLASAFYGNPSARMKVTGITGTNGKTTTTYLIESVLKEAECVPGVIGTVNYRYKDIVVPATHTTPAPLELQSLLSEMVDAGVDQVVMEVSSHALDQDRTAGIHFHSAIFTNITQDHLDYHKTIEQYFQSKTKLFRGLETGAFAVINNDDPFGHPLKSMTKAHVVTYALNSKADVTARDIVYHSSHTAFLVLTPLGPEVVRSKLIGRHNVYNMLAAIAWGVQEGVPLKKISAGIENFKTVPGRLERVFSRAPFSIFVDYAHTEDALKNCIETLRLLTVGRVIVVFGCGGERDTTKRPKMGNVVTHLADYAVITTDNPRSEDPQTIIDDIVQGILSRNYSVIPDRHTAIVEALSMARPGDIVLVAGKGHENYQIIKDKREYFDDREEIRACLQSMSY